VLLSLVSLRSGNPPASASQSTGITGASHCAQPHFKKFTLQFKIFTIRKYYLIFNILFCL
uniref:Uncharacterized protein n=1 Tax=Macaca fascicularis TaxID=9541 RepID=A0A7N9CKW1_MACFA